MSLKKEDNNIQFGLALVNEKVAEIKKKIQLSEGQRKAHFEECDCEKKKNLEKIRFLKSEVKEIYSKYFESVTYEDSILKADVLYTKDLGIIRSKKIQDAIEFLDLKCLDLKKQMDIFKYRNKLKKNKLKKLGEECRSLRDEINGKKCRKGKIICNKSICVLENQINRVKMNLMEAEHVNKKYKTIRLQLLSDSLDFESLLKNVEEHFKKQCVEIEHLQKVNKEALGLRDITKGTLLRNEIMALNAGKIRDSQLQDFRHKVEDRRLELEKLERKIFPTGRVAFDESGQGGYGTQGNEISTQTVRQLEAFFSKLKMATGETEIEDVLPRFLYQKETKERLDFLKKINEEEKKQLELQKEISLAELEAFKFAESKDIEEIQEEMEVLISHIKDQNNLKENYMKELKRVKCQILDIKDCLYSCITDLQKMNDELPPYTSKEKEEEKVYTEILNCLIRKIQSGLEQIGTGQNLHQILKTLEQKEYQHFFLHFLNETSGTETLLFPDFLQDEEIKQVKIPQPSLLIQENEDEEDVLTRTHLKRQAQLLVDVKSRKKFNRVLNFPKTKK